MYLQKQKKKINKLDKQAIMLFEILQTQCDVCSSMTHLLGNKSWWFYFSLNIIHCLLTQLYSTLNLSCTNAPIKKSFTDFQ